MANRVDQVPGCRVECKIDVQRGKKNRFEQVGRFGNTEASVRKYLTGKGYTVFSVSFIEPERPKEKQPTYRWHTISKEEPEDDRSCDYIVLDCTHWKGHPTGCSAGTYTITFIH